MTISEKLLASDNAGIFPPARPQLAGRFYSGQSLKTFS
jgi:hypothetical protein